MTAPDLLRALLDEESRVEPYPLLRAIREHGPFRFSPDVVVAAGYQDCARVLRDPTVSSQRGRDVAARGRTRAFIHLDPPEHSRLRRLVTLAFSPRVVTALSPHIRQLTHELLTLAGTTPKFDVVSGLAYPLPIRVISELLGVPFRDFPRFQGWARALSYSVEPRLPSLSTADSGETTEAMDRARVRFISYFRTLIRQRRVEPADDLLSELIRVRDGTDRLSESELLATCVMLLNAGHETTVNLISNGVLALLRHPDQLAALRANPALAGRAVEEVLRYDSPVQLTARTATQPGFVGTVPVRAGDLILLLLSAANRDPVVCAEPERFDITRDAVPHLSFAAGPHFCIGASLARTEAAIVFEEFATRLCGPALLDERPSYKPNLTLRGPERLVVGFSSVTPAPGC